jgi:hypothetical protein
MNKIQRLYRNQFVGLISSSAMGELLSYKKSPKEVKEILDSIHSGKVFKNGEFKYKTNGRGK